MITSYTRGCKIIFMNGVWFYLDTMTPDDNSRPCKRCGKLPINGYDACLGHIDGVKSACCGHGVEKPYSIMEA